MIVPMHERGRLELALTVVRYHAQLVWDQVRDKRSRYPAGTFDEQLMPADTWLRTPEYLRAGLAEPEPEETPDPEWLAQ